jgi:predicted MFS family arabinose efflux permease
MGSRRVAFFTITGGYLAATTAESVLAPAFPLVARDLGLGTGWAGFALAVLSGAIALGNLGGGVILARRGARLGASLGLAVAAAGSFVTAASNGAGSLLGSLVVLGAGSGLFFASGLTAAASLAGYARRGLAIGVFGVAFSGGLALAGVLAAIGDAAGWRVAFVAAGGLASASAASIAVLRIPARPARSPDGPPPPAREAFTMPLAVGGVAAASQYGTVGFFPVFAVQAWQVSPATAALLVTAARIVSIPAKVLSGGAADRAGALRVAARLGLGLTALGLWWTLLPGPWLAAWAAVLFAVFVSGLGPVANVLALDGLEERPQLLGAFRASQIGIAAVTSALLGGAAELFGLRSTLAVAAAVIPGSLVVLGLAQARRARTSTPS